MHSFTGTTALITGASKGIGEAYAHQLAAQGAELILVARSADALDILAIRLRETYGVAVHAFPVDIFDRAAAGSIAETLAERGIEVDLLINNAGMSAVGPFLTRPLKPNIDSVDLHISNVMSLVHAIGGRMLERGGGGIINVALLAVFQPMPFQASYGGTKAFVLSFTEALAEELRGSEVRVMAVHPGPVATNFFDSTTATLDSKAVPPHRIAELSLKDFADGRSISFPGSPSDRGIAFLSRLLPRKRVARLSASFNREAGHDRVTDL